ncbi:MAG: sensor histidine kinase [Lachnospiraceae bacterium]|nr:sensor histidine kinase [Lachnospiraceae bacterium]
MDVKRNRKWKFLAAVIVFLAVLVLCIQYIKLTGTPMEYYDISPVNSPDRWTFFSYDGTLAPADYLSMPANSDMLLKQTDGELPVNETGAAVICLTTLDESLFEKPLFTVTSGKCDCVIFINGSPVYSPSGRFADRNFSDTAYAANSASGQFIAPITGEGDVLMMLVQFQGDNHNLKQLPKLSVYKEIINYYTQFMSVAANAAFPAGMYFALSLFLSVLFFFGLWKNNVDAGMILLAFCSLSMALTSTTPYAAYVFGAMQWTTGTWFCNVLPIAMMGWILWYRFNKKIRLFTLPIFGAVTAIMFYFLIKDYGKINPPGASFMNAMQSYILPAIILLSLLIAGFDAKKGNQWFRGFLKFFVFSIPVTIAIWLFSVITDGRLALSVKTAFDRITSIHSFFAVCELLCTLLLILCFIHALAEMISVLVRHESEMRELSLKEQFARENMEILLNSQQETHRMRHEMRHHIVLINEMLKENERGRLQEYISKLSDTISSIPSGSYSSNLVVNAIAAHYLNKAKASGINVTTDIRTADELSLPDEDICVFLTNMLENALNACLALPEGNECFIRFKLISEADHLIIRCENSTDSHFAGLNDELVPKRAEDSNLHGYGLDAMRQIAGKHSGQFIVSSKDHVFTIEATL